MPVETFDKIDSLDANNPVASEGIVNGDDHIRGIKSTLLATFPNITGAVTSTHTAIDAIAALLVSGVLRANGACPAGAVVDFARTTAPTGWLECNGAAVSRTTYADLFAAIGTTFGAGDGSTTFNVPYDRYRVGKNQAGAAVGTYQASQNKTHTHTGSGTTSTVSNDHTHYISGMTGAADRSLSHSHGVSGGTLGGTSMAGVSGGGTYIACVAGGYAPVNVDAAAAPDHLHSFAGYTGGIQSNHTHTYSFTTSGGSADGSVVRPETLVFLTCIKT